jgi:hypothetical protein
MAVKIWQFRSDLASRIVLVLCTKPCIQWPLHEEEIYWPYSKLLRRWGSSLSRAGSALYVMLCFHGPYSTYDICDKTRDSHGREKRVNIFQTRIFGGLSTVHHMHGGSCVGRDADVISRSSSTRH